MRARRCRTAPRAPREPARRRARGSSASGVRIRLDGRAPAAPCDRTRSRPTRRARARRARCPRPVSSSTTPRWSGAPRTHAVPRTGCPANGSSVRGVKIRTRTRPALFRRKHERRLREPDLERERLHGLDVELARIGENGELIPLERPVGEHVDDDVAKAGHGNGTRRYPRPMLVFLVRHAHAEKGEPDASRPLSERGRGEARALGEQLAAHTTPPLARPHEPAPASAPDGRAARRRRRARRSASTTALAPGATEELFREPLARASTGRSRSSATSPTARSIATERHRRGPGLPDGRFRRDPAEGLSRFKLRLGRRMSQSDARSRPRPPRQTFHSMTRFRSAGRPRSAPRSRRARSDRPGRTRRGSRRSRAPANEASSSSSEHELAEEEPQQALVAHLEEVVLGTEPVRDGAAALRRQLVHAARAAVRSGSSRERTSPASSSFRSSG